MAIRIYMGLLRNGKVYATKQLAIHGLTQSATNDGVAKLARYLDSSLGGDPIIHTLVGFYANATGVTVNFENIELTYENSLTTNDWRWARLIIYRPYNTNSGLSNDLTAMKTWKFNFKNCKYNGKKVTENNFGQHNQVFYLYNVGNDGSIKDAKANGLDLNFE